MQGDKGDHFYIIKGGEAVVFQQEADGVRKVNHLFKADFFGEKALLSDEPRCPIHPPTLLPCDSYRVQTFTRIMPHPNRLAEQIYINCPGKLHAPSMTGMGSFQIP